MGAACSSPGGGGAVAAAAAASRGAGRPTDEAPAQQPATTTTTTATTATARKTDFNDDAGMVLAGQTPRVGGMGAKKRIAFESGVGSGVNAEAENKPLCFVVVGAERDAAVRETLPALSRLVQSELLPAGSFVLAVALSSSGSAAPFTPPRAVADEFTFITTTPDAFTAATTSALEQNDCTKDAAHRRLIFVFAGGVDDATLGSTALAAKSIPSEWSRVVVEPPWRLLEAEPWSSITSAFGEDATYFLDRHASSDVTRRIVALRFGNRTLEPTWNRNHIRAVMVDYATTSLSGPDVRDVVAEHLLDLVALVAMERPNTRFGSDVRAAKSEVLASLHAASPSKWVAARAASQASSASSPTMLTAVFEFDTNRWRGVPFVVRAGRGLAANKCEVRVLYWRAVGADRLWNDQKESLKENEVVVRAHPLDHTSLHLVTNAAGLATHITPDVAVLTGEHHAVRPFVPGAHERLLFEVSRGKMASFATLGSLRACFAAMSDPAALAAMSREPTSTYAVGSRFGSAASDDLLVELVGGSCPWVSPGSSPGPATPSPRAIGPSPLLPPPTPWATTLDASVLRDVEFQMHIGFDAMQRMVRRFSREMEEGLAGRPSSLKMLPSFVASLPSGSESGAVLALDMGGTNFRVARFELKPNSPPVRTHEVHARIPAECVSGPKADAKALFGFMAEEVKRLLVESGATADAKSIPLGFTFSFPVQQLDLKSGTLIAWTKGFQTKGVVGEEVVALLQTALRERGVTGAHVEALVNDTVGTLATLATLDSRARVAMILGTGTNAAYLERVERIPKLASVAGPPGTTNMVINTEWGNFGSGEAGALPGWSAIDADVDAASANKGQQWLEKMVSGHTMGEVCRLFLKRLHAAGELWAGLEGSSAVAILDTPFTFTGEQVSQVEADLSEDLRVVARVEKTWGVAASTLHDRRVVQHVGRIVAERAARITACALTALVMRVSVTSSDVVSVAVDGSVFEHHPSFRQRLERALDQLGCSHVELALAKDGSGLGAALVAGAAASPPRPASS